MFSAHSDRHWRRSLSAPRKIALQTWGWAFAKARRSGAWRFTRDVIPMCTLQRLDVQWSPFPMTSLIYLPHRLLDSLQGKYYLSAASLLGWLALNRSRGSHEVVELPMQRLDECNEFFLDTSAWLNEQPGTHLSDFWKSLNNEHSDWWSDVLCAGQTDFAGCRWHWGFCDGFLWWISWWHVGPLHAFDHQSPPAEVLGCTEEDRATFAQSWLCLTRIYKRVATHHNSKWFWWARGWPYLPHVGRIVSQTLFFRIQLALQQRM